MKTKVFFLLASILAYSFAANCQPVINRVANSFSISFAPLPPALLAQPYPPPSDSLHIVPAGMPKTRIILEYGDGNFTEMFNSEHTLFNSPDNGPSVVTAMYYYDTTRRPKDNAKLLNGTAGSVQITSSVRESESQKINIEPFENTFWPDESKLLIVSYRGQKGMVAILYNNPGASFFKPVKSATDSNRIENLNVKLVRQHHGERVDTSLSNYPNGSFKQKIKEACSAYFNGEFKNAIFINNTDNINDIRNVFITLNPITTDSLKFNDTSVTNVKAIFIPFNANAEIATSEKQLTFTMADHDPNSITASLKCMNFTSMELVPAKVITYTINFQNEGTENATKVTIRDTIPVGFNINTFKFRMAKAAHTQWGAITSGLIKVSAFPGNERVNLGRSRFRWCLIKSGGYNILKAEFEGVEVKGTYGGQLVRMNNPDTRGLIIFDITKNAGQLFDRPGWNTPFRHGGAITFNDGSPVNCRHTFYKCSKLAMDLPKDMAVKQN